MMAGGSETVGVARQTQTLESRMPGWLALAIPAVAMSLGWGLRGQFGGPRGAMVPGALVALALTLVARRRPGVPQVWLVAAAGALGFAIGGEETYMQTVGLTHHTDTAFWGYLGLLLKGGVWGGLGGLFIGAAFRSERIAAAPLFVAFNLALALSFLGYEWVNAHRLIYFSGGAGKPRQEGWAGLWCFYLPLLAFAARARARTAVRLSLYGTLGCGAGFVMAVAADNLGERYLMAATGGFMDWWKVAECGLGLIGGLALGWAWRTADQETPPQATQQPVKRLSAGLLALLALDLLLCFYLLDALDLFRGWIGKAPFVFLVPVLVLLMSRSRALTLVLGAAMPISVTFWNVQAYWVGEKHLLGVIPSVIGLALLTAAVAALTGAWSGSPRSLFLLMMWATLACAWLKMGIPPPGSWTVYLVVQGIFTLMVLWLTQVTRVPSHDTGPAIDYALQAGEE